MAKTQNDLIYDAAFAYVRTRGTKITVCNGQPTTYTQATTTSGNMLAETTTPISSTEYTLANGDTSGRKLTTPAKNGLTVQRSANANHIAVVSSSDASILYITTVTSQSLTTGNQVNVAGFDFEILDVA